MPAIQLSRLKVQVTTLGNDFNQPEVFIRRLHDLLDLYTDRTFRPGGGSPPPNLTPHYNVSIQVLHQIENDLAERASQDPQAAAILADHLWADDWYEPHLLAVHLLGALCLLHPETVVTRLLAWADPAEDPQLLQLLLTSGKVRLQIEHPELWLSVAGRWINTNQKPYQAMGLTALRTLVEDRKFENLPAVFSLLEPLVQAAPPALLPEVSNLVGALAARSPVETAYLLRHALVVSQAQNLPRLIRRCLGHFPPEAQERLREALRANTNK